jgi:hypothetical protein
MPKARNTQPLIRSPHQNAHVRQRKVQMTK